MSINILNSESSTAIAKQQRRLLNAIGRMNASDDTKEHLLRINRDLVSQEMSKFDTVVNPGHLQIDIDGNLLYGNWKVEDPEYIVFKRTNKYDSHLTQALGIPKQFFDREIGVNPDIMAAFVNEKLDRETKPMLLRTFLGQDPQSPGVARAMLSPSYGARENLDMFTAFTEAIAVSQKEIKIKGSAFTESRVYMEWSYPDLREDVEHILRAYHLPDHMVKGEKVLYFGGLFRNSETGDGAFSVAPRALFLYCNNGMVRESDKLRHIHRGDTKPVGFTYSPETRRLNSMAAASEMRDMIEAHTSEKWRRERIDEYIAASQEVVENVIHLPQVVGNELGLNQDEMDRLREYFVSHKDHTSLGMVNATTLLAQELDRDKRHDIESKAFDLMAKIPRLDLQAGRLRRKQE
ncbi:hypothetical protein [uncultured Sphaerochaeta sp.]|uniref:hypothetical protein n=1 Tax=uncultured Sphaerochaeta sp. TaxID=886478 RepID=UPI00263618F1|nr:hypothetical protein [uncultured Sphaerochaeta sp.]